MSPESLVFVSHCLERCFAEHSQDSCGTLSSGPVSPARVVDLVNVNTNSIRITRYQEELGPCLALSHCWGGTVPLKPTLSSTSLFDSVDLQALPNTFRDAITLTTRLGYSYLWIDSLCIYQDSERDWERESSKMGDIYRNAVLTIAASSSKSSGVSFLAPRPSLGPRTLDVAFTDQNHK